MQIKYFDLSRFPKVHSDWIENDDNPFIVGLAYSIRKHGLFNPVQLSGSGSRFHIADGQNRICAMQYLRHRQLLPWRLNKIPCLLLARSTSPAPFSPHIPILMGAGEFLDSIRRSDEDGRSVDDIAREFYVEPDIVADMLRLKRLNPELVSLFRKSHLTLEQAVALSEINDSDRQMQVLQALGPYAKPEEIRRMAQDSTEYANTRMRLFRSRRTEHVFCVT